MANGHLLSPQFAGYIPISSTSHCVPLLIFFAHRLHTNRIGLTEQGQHPALLPRDSLSKLALSVRITYIFTPFNVQGHRFVIQLHNDSEPSQWTDDVWTCQVYSHF